MTTPLSFECAVHFGNQGRGNRRVLQPGTAPATPVYEPGRVPRVARLMALAIRYDRLLCDGAIASHAELADLGHVTRARISQIMNLLNLAPDIQEAILFLARVERGRAPIILRDLQPVASVPDWRKQRAMWKELEEGRGS